MSSIDLSKYQQKPSASNASTNTEQSVSGLEKLSDALSKDITLFEKKFGQTQKEAFYSELDLPVFHMLYPQLLSQGCHIYLNIS